MKHLKGVGFTIIETMLFLAISGFLFVAILASTGNSVNVQRYHDSVYSLHSFLQKQISEVVNVDNDNNLPSRGQSDSVILGRFITISPSDGTSLITVKRVIGNDSDISSSASDDISVFKQSGIKTLDSDPSSGNMNGFDTYSLEWGAALIDVATKPIHYSTMSILILRSPSSGIVRTFINSKKVVVDSDIATMLDSTYSSKPVSMCVDSNGMISSKQSEILIHANASSQSDIEVVKEMDSGC